MLVLRFEGWFQCRLATNPDPTDEPRGLSGYTFALAGEPDLDRIIRFQHPVAQRSHGPDVGVRITSVRVDGRERADHPLMHADVDLLDGPKFESRNLLLTDDRAGIGLIHPFVIRIGGDGFSLRRGDVLLPEDPAAALHQIPAAVLNRRGPTDRAGMRIDRIRIAEATGIEDPVAYRLERRRLLLGDLEAERDPVARAALEKRIRELEIDDPHGVRVLTLSAVQVRGFGLNGPVEISGSAGDIAGRIEVHSPWPIEFWMGAWDADALCGFVGGMLTIPLSRDGL